MQYQLKTRSFGGDYELHIEKNVFVASMNMLKASGTALESKSTSNWTQYSFNPVSP